MSTKETRKLRETLNRNGFQTKDGFSDGFEIKYNNNWYVAGHSPYWEVYYINKKTGNNAEDSLAESSPDEYTFHANTISELLNKL